MPRLENKKEDEKIVSELFEDLETFGYLRWIKEDVYVLTDKFWGQIILQIPSYIKYVLQTGKKFKGDDELFIEFMTLAILAIISFERMKMNIPYEQATIFDEEYIKACTALAVTIYKYNKDMAVRILNIVKSILLGFM